MIPEETQLIENLKSALSVQQFKNQAGNQVAGELMTANIELRTGTLLLQAQVQQISQELGIEKAKTKALLEEVGKLQGGSPTAPTEPTAPVDPSVDQPPADSTQDDNVGNDAA